MTSIIITSVLLMTAAIAIRGIFGKKLSGRVLMLIWAIVFIKLAVPVSIPSPVSVMNLFSAEETVTQKIEAAANPQETPVNIPENKAENSAATTAPSLEQSTVYSEQPLITAQPSEEKQETENSVNILLAVYAVAAVILELGVLTAYTVCSMRFSKCKTAEIPESFAENNIRFVRCRLGTPAVFGIFHPIIIIPENMGFSDNKKLGHIILHEKMHIRHKDQLWSLLTLMICCANWFDPLVWICRILYLKDTEKWCDESVIEIIGRENRKEYADTLIDCAEKKSRPFMLISGFGESDIRSRIKAIMSAKKFRRSVCIFAIILIIAAAAVFGTGKAVRPQTADGEPASSEDGGSYSESIGILNRNISGFHTNISGDGYLISCTNGATDLCIYFSDSEDGALVYKGDSSLKLERFDPYHVALKSSDVTGDGVNDLVMLTEITGTGVLDNYCNIIDGAALCEIPVDTEATAELIAGYFQDRLTEETFSEEDPHITVGQLFANADPDGEIKLIGGMQTDETNGIIYGTCEFGFVRNLKEYSRFYSANVFYRYEDGIFKPYDLYLGEARDMGSVPAEIWLACENYLTDYWRYITKTGSLSPELYTSDPDAA